MPAECAFTLPNGHKCRCMATRDHAFCRHHGAPSRQRPASLRDRWSRLACWRDVGRSLNEMPADDLPHEIVQILASLLTNRISERTAGRFLRVLLQRCGDVPVMPISESGGAWPEPISDAATPLSFRPVPVPQEAMQTVNELAQSGNKTVQALLAKLVLMPTTTSPKVIPSRP
jgi:hypothetical protein